MSTLAQWSAAIEQQKHLQQQASNHQAYMELCLGKANQVVLELFQVGGKAWVFERPTGSHYEQPRWLECQVLDVRPNENQIVVWICDSRAEKRTLKDRADRFRPFNPNESAAS